MSSKATRNLRFLKKRHEQTGFDCDYLGKLSESELEFMERFAWEFYEGKSEDPEQKKAGNRRRYSATHDTMGKRTTQQTDFAADSIEDDLDPEKALLIAEQLQESKK